jgi:hypothetical protein
MLKSLSNQVKHFDHLKLRVSSSRDSLLVSKNAEVYPFYITVTDIIKRDQFQSGGVELYFEILKHPLNDFESKCYIPTVYINEKFEEQRRDMFVYKWANFGNVVAALREELHIRVLEYQVLYIDAFSLCHSLNHADPIYFVPQSTIIYIQALSSAQTQSRIKASQGVGGFEDVCELGGMEERMILERMEVLKIGLDCRHKEALQKFKLSQTLATKGHRLDEIEALVDKLFDVEH